MKETASAARRFIDSSTPPTLRRFADAPRIIVRSATRKAALQNIAGCGMKAVTVSGTYRLRAAVAALHGDTIDGPTAC